MWLGKNKLALGGILATAAGLPLQAQETPEAVTEESLSVSGACCENACGGSRWQRLKAHLQEKWWGYPEEFIETPLGWSVRTHIATQVANGNRARMVVYQSDFVPDTDVLKPMGKRRLEKIALILPTNLFPVVLEQSREEAEIDDASRARNNLRRALDEQRVQAVLAALRQGSVAVPSHRVIVGPDAARGLRGVEASIIDENLLDRTDRGGRGISSGNNSASPLGFGVTNGQ